MDSGLAELLVLFGVSRHDGLGLMGVYGGGLFKCINHYVYVEDAMLHYSTSVNYTDYKISNRIGD
jgi:hypothetical protein